MVVAYLYGYIDKQTDGIDRHGDRHKDREIWSGEQKRKNSSYLPICLGCLACRFGLVWLVRFTLVRFTLVRLVWFGSDF